MNTREAKRKQRAWLWSRQHGRCFYCGVHMTWPVQQRHVRPPDTEATIEHLDSRLSSERGQYPGLVRHVLACRKCNGQRAKEEVERLTREDLWQRSGRAPSISGDST